MHGIEKIVEAVSLHSCALMERIPTELVFGCPAGTVADNTHRPGYIKQSPDFVWGMWVPRIADTTGSWEGSAK